MPSEKTTRDRHEGVRRRDTEVVTMIQLSTSSEANYLSRKEAGTGSSVAAIIATYNRRRDLEICLDALLRQSIPLDAIYIIDNASTDDTAKAISTRQEESIRYHRLSENTGSAGGFRMGMELAYADGFKWFWITDNDSIPAVDSLEKLLDAARLQPDVMALAPTKICTNDNHILACDSIWDHTTGTLSTPTIDDYRRLNCIEVDWVPNTGLLISRSAISKVGHLRADLFAFGEDVEYCVRLRPHSKVLVVTDSVVFHPEMGMGWPVPFASLKKLYFLRRNEVYLRLRGLAWPRLGLFGTFWQCLITSLNIVRRQDHRLRRLLVVALATYHGVIGRLGPAPRILE